MRHGAMQTTQRRRRKLQAVKHLGKLAYGTLVAREFGAHADIKAGREYTYITLRRLAARGLLETVITTLEDTHVVIGKRPTNFFRLTSKGERALELALKKFAGVLR